MLLLHLMAQIFPQKIRAIYIDHQLQDQSAEEWAEIGCHTGNNIKYSLYYSKVQIANGNLEANTSSTLSNISTFTRK